MANMFDYLNWRGDLSFEKDPFNDVDNLILSQLAYVDFKGIVPEGDEAITLKAASDTFFDINDEKKLRASKSFIREAPFLMREAAKTKRFGELLLYDYEDVLDEQREEQFCAFHIRIAKNQTYIAFRGTDDTLVGWKEDFNLGFIMPVPAQRDALNYVNSTVKKEEGKLIFGGHSKGGNLAIYAAVLANTSIKKRIETVYNNDGPGFDSTFLKTKQYQEMLPRIISIVPKHSVVGMLLNHDEDYLIVESTQSGLMQHDAMSWKVEGKTFVLTDKLDVQSRRLNIAISRWIDKTSYEEREEFVNALFGLVYASGAKNLSQINSAGFKSMSSVIMSFSAMKKDERNMIIKIFRSLSGEVGKAYKEV